MKYTAILLLGVALKKNDDPTDELRSRVKTAAEVYRKLGGEKMCTSLSNFVVEGRPSNLNLELHSISEFVLDIYRLYQLEIQERYLQELHC